MSTNNNKPDLSDLKARLGLKPAAKPGAAKPASSGSPSASGARSAVPRPGASSPSAQPSGGASPLSEAAVATPSRPVPAPSGAQPVQAQPAPARPAGPPAAASGPPPTAMVPPPKAKVEPRPKPVPISDQELAEIEAAAASLDNSGGIFSKSAIIVMIVLALVGAFFGFFAAQGQQSRQIEIARIDDAKALQEAIDPSLATFSEMATQIAALSPSEVDFEAAEALAAQKFVVSGEVLASNRLLLGRDVISPLTAYMAESAVLSELLVEHRRLTTVVDKSEIERLLSENEVLDKDLIAVVFDFRHLFTQGGDDTYRPRPGRLVTLKSLDRDDQGMLEASMLNSARTQKVEMQSLVPLERGEILKTAGDNALQRYERRVNDIKTRAEKLQQRINPLSSSLDELASQPTPPLLSL